MKKVVLTSIGVAVIVLAAINVNIALKSEGISKSIMANVVALGNNENPGSGATGTKKQIIYYAPRFSEIIYSIDSTGLHPAVGLTNLSVPTDHILEQWNRQNTLMLDNTNYLKDIIYIYETERYISFQLETGSFFNLIYDKENQKSYRLDPIYKTTGMFYIQGSTGTHFVGTMLPDREYLSDIMKQESLSGLTENSNPVTVLLDFVL
ncbi:MAG: 6-bladed beta-propeller [Bacteroidales bacterium]|jgi:hypothetical protein|nr:6-bladed beta-propeller [Bacteroidales bacterium]